MRILLDTHCWLWLQAHPDRFAPEVLSLLENGENRLYLSAASSWEISIKYRLGKLSLPSPPSEYVPSRMEISGVLGLRVEHAHALFVSELPALHRDPFDRLLVSQGILESLTILTADPLILQYEVPALSAVFPRP